MQIHFRLSERFCYVMLGIYLQINSVQIILSFPQLTHGTSRLQKYQFINCGTATDALNVTTLNLTPDPITFPGTLGVDFAGEFRSTLDAPLSVRFLSFLSRVCFSSNFSRFSQISQFLDYAHLLSFACPPNPSWSFRIWNFIVICPLLISPYTPVLIDR